MPKLRHLPVLLLLVLHVGSVECANWKYIGTNSIKGKEYAAYYDEASMNINGGIISVWLKFIRDKDLEMTDAQHLDTITKLAAKKIVDGYFPPFMHALSDTTDFEGRLIDVVHSEIIVNSFRPRVSLAIHYALDCRRRLIRALSSTRYNERGESIGSTDDSDWRDVGPETFADLMLRVLCGH